MINRLGEHAISAQMEGTEAVETVTSELNTAIHNGTAEQETVMVFEDYLRAGLAKA